MLWPPARLLPLTASPRTVHFFTGGGPRGDIVASTLMVSPSALLGRSGRSGHRRKALTQPDPTGQSALPAVPQAAERNYVFYLMSL